MMIRYGGLIFLSLLLAAGLGCSSKRAHQIPPEIPTELPSEEEARRARESTREAIPMLPQGARDLGGADPPPTQGGDEGALRPGYRIQLFATATRELAEARAAEARELFDEPIYVQAEGALYKVHVGDCTSRDEADALRRAALGLGHDGAFVVDALIKVP